MHYYGGFRANAGQCSLWEEQLVVGIMQDAKSTYHPK